MRSAHPVPRWAKKIPCPVCRKEHSLPQFVRLNLSANSILSGDCRERLARSIESLKNDHLIPNETCLKEWENEEMARLITVPTVVNTNSLVTGVERFVNNEKVKSRLSKMLFLKRNLHISIKGLEAALKSLTKQKGTLKLPSVDQHLPAASPQRASSLSSLESRVLNSLESSRRPERERYGSRRC